MTIQFPNRIFGQETESLNRNNWGLKIGLTQIRYQVKNLPIIWGNGCGFFQNIESDNTSLGAKGGIFYHLAFTQRSSLVFGPEILFTKSEKKYFAGVTCIGGIHESDSKGTLKFQNYKLFFPVVFRRETSFYDVFFEVGGYHDLSLGTTTEYDYTYFEYLDNRWQPLPEPYVTSGSKTFTGSDYGLIFGMGNANLLASRQLELQAQYYLSLSKSVSPGSSRYISQSGIDLSINFRF